MAVGQLGIMPSFAQAPAASSGQRSTELFNRVMDDVLGRRLTVRLTERDPGNGSAAHRHPGSHTVGYILEGSYEVKINDDPVQTLKSGEVFYEPPNALHAISRNATHGAATQISSNPSIRPDETRHGPRVRRRTDEVIE